VTSAAARPPQSHAPASSARSVCGSRHHTSPSQLSIPMIALCPVCCRHRHVASALRQPSSAGAPACRRVARAAARRRPFCCVGVPYPHSLGARPARRTQPHARNNAFSLALPCGHRAPFVPMPAPLPHPLASRSPLPGLQTGHAGLLGCALSRPPQPPWAGEHRSPSLVCRASRSLPRHPSALRSSPGPATNA